MYLVAPRDWRRLLMERKYIDGTKISTGPRIGLRSPARVRRSAVGDISVRRGLGNDPWPPRKLPTYPHVSLVMVLT